MSDSIGSRRHQTAGQRRYSDRPFQDGVRGLEAAADLEREGVDVEVIDPRTLRPLDTVTLVESVKKTNRAVIVEEGWPFCGVGAQIVDVLQLGAFDYLDAPILRVTGADVPTPYAKNLEHLAFPDKQRVKEAVNKVLYRM